MELDINTIKKLDNEDIYNILKSMIEQIYRDYKYANISENNFKEIVFKEIEKSKIEYDGTTSYRNFMKKN